jgi:2-polyprenyl-3-methyl-5-hydroxy-6-metoxy-1,4-benzoquinol methylase
MSDFKKRSSQKELLDRNDIPFEHIKQNMKELDFINTYLGGHKITIDGIRALLPSPSAEKLVLRFCEIGCGGGDNLRVIKKWCIKKNINASFIGIDINPHCIAYAQSRTENEGIEFICSDYSKVQFEEKPHIIFSSLFCHHFTDEELKQQYAWMMEHASVGFFVNDLQRHPFAYYSIKLLTQLFSKSYLVKNDAPLSVLRGFHKKELANIFNHLSMLNYQLNWKWAFRWLLVYKHEQ